MAAAAAQGNCWRLRLVGDAPDLPAEFVVRDGGALTTIGRDNSNTIQLADQRISRLHATLYRCEEDGEWKLKDNKSSNGSYVNGQRVDIHRLEDGDLVSFAYAKKARIGEFARGALSVPFSFKFEHYQSRRRQSSQETQPRLSLDSASKRQRSQRQRSPSPPSQPLRMSSLSPSQSFDNDRPVTRSMSRHPSDIRPGAILFRNSSSECPRSNSNSQTGCSAEGEFLLQAQGDLNCAICQDLFVVPTMLQACGHSFCAHCIEQWLCGKAGECACPVCRTLVQAEPVTAWTIEGLLTKYIRTLPQERQEDWAKRVAAYKMHQQDRKEEWEQLDQGIRASDPRFLSIEDAWRPSEQRKFACGVRACQWPARGRYCEIVGLTPQYITDASAAKLILASENVGLDLSTNPSISTLKRMLWAFVRYGKGV